MYETYPKQRDAVNLFLTYYVIFIQIASRELPALCVPLVSRGGVTSPHHHFIFITLQLGSE